MEWLSDLGSFVFGDAYAIGASAAPAGRVATYEDVHASVQSVLIPDSAPRGVTLHVLQSLNRNFALTHRMFLETSAGGAASSGAAADHRVYALGGVLTGVTQARTKFRVSSQLDSRGVSKSVAVVDLNGATRVTAQAVDNPRDSFTDWGITAVHRGADYAAALRLKGGPGLGLSYHQRLAPFSRFSLGGEVFATLPALRAAAAEEVDDPKGKKGLEWAVGVAHDTSATKSALHVDAVDGRGVTLSLHHLLRVSDASSLAVKFIHDTSTRASMMSTGYSMRFRSSGSAVTGMADSYGNARLLLERTPMQDVKITVSADCNFWPLSASEKAADKMMMAFTGRARARPDKFRLGVMVQVGAPAPVQRPLSPCLLTKDIFGAR